MDSRLLEHLSDAVGTPPQDALARSRRRVEAWFAATAPLVHWDVIESPLGPLYVAATTEGLCNLDFGVGVTPDVFLSQLDPLARTEQDGDSLAAVIAQLREYFAGQRARFDLPLDLRRTTPFQRRVLETALGIPAGVVWTYGRVARAIGQPQASRAVGHALGRNPMPIVIPCHRVIGSDGGLHGYGAGSGLETKAWLLRFEGAL